MATGCSASASAVFIRIPSTPCSMVTQASDAVPTPASTTTGTLSRRLMVRMPYGLSRPRPLPIGDASGMTAAQPASSSRSAVIRSSLVYARTVNPSFTRVRAAWRRPSVSGSSVSRSPITSSFTNSLNPASRASRA